MNLHSVVIVLTYFAVAECNTVSDISRTHCPNTKASINAIRKRRHLTFPAGSNAVITISLAKTFMTHIPSGWYMTTDLNVMYPLPDPEFTLAHSRRKLHHRQKKDLWENLQNAIDLHNYNGRACVLRSICEAKMLLAPPGKSLIHDLLRAVFTSSLFEKEFQEEIGDSYPELFDPKVCDIFHDCPISLIQIALAFNKPKNKLV
ncbi:uncharacterized protein LOC113510837 [Galleria mellonella]|uniref:Uncharacterized protein LOC113510837 n=1 Tax=Galleria mellonella TaxID=7137 RepID=A0A6J1WI58_GALME|nr:uncharacterized protein LOC113510837 [Galleria mellonella]